MANYCTRWRPWVKGLSLDGGRLNFSKKPPRRFLSERPIEWAYFRPDPSRWTVPLMLLFFLQTHFSQLHWKYLEVVLSSCLRTVFNWDVTSYFISLGTVKNVYRSWSKSNEWVSKTLETEVFFWSYKCCVYGYKKGPGYRTYPDSKYRSGFRRAKLSTKIETSS